jgi:hypothetical protein
MRQHSVEPALRQLLHRVRISTSFSGGLAATLLAVGLPQTAGAFDEGMWAPTTPLTATGGTQPATSRPVLATGGTGQGALLQSTRKG